MYQAIEEYKTLRAEINMGLKEGYEGLGHTKQEVIDFLQSLYQAAVDKGEYLPGLGVQSTVLTYQHIDTSYTEPSLTIFGDKNPFYFNGSDDDFKRVIGQIACELGEHFQQFRVYITYTPVTIQIIQKEV